MANELTMRVLFLRFIYVFTLIIHACGSYRVRRGFCSTRNLDIWNGQYRLRSGNSVAEFTCNDGFKLYGMERIVCFGSKWSNDPPSCISNTCEEIKPTSTLRIKEEFDGSLLKFSCAVMYKLDGQNQLICDGTDWNAPTPSCKPWNPPVSCDFEDAELCGWSHHDEDDQDWRWNTGKTSTSRTGPSHDHTLGEVGEGHYMYFETSSPTRTNHQAVLKSPMYPASYSQQKCFNFWFHILGEGDISDLEVFIKPESVKDLQKMKRIFHVNKNGGDVWHDESAQVPPQSEPFQVLFVATRGTNYRSDIAIDDVALGDCTGTLSPVHLSTVKDNDTATTEPSTSTAKPSVTQESTSKKTRETTPKPTPAKTTAAATTRTTTTKTTTTKRPETTQTTKAVPKPSKAPESHTTRKTSTSSEAEITTVTNTNGNSTITSSKRTAKPVINPNLPSRGKHIPGEARDGPSVVWIVLGVAIVLVIVCAVLFTIYIFRRKQNRRRKQDPLSSCNPLYLAVNGDESAVHFPADDTNDFNNY